MQSVPITTKVVSSKPVGLQGALETTFCDKVCQWLTTGQWFSQGFPPPIKLTPRYNWNIVESGIKHNKPKPNLV